MCQDVHLRYRPFHTTSKRTGVLFAVFTTPRGNARRTRVRRSRATRAHNAEFVNDPNLRTLKTRRAACFPPSVEDRNGCPRTDDSKTSVVHRIRFVNQKSPGGGEGGFFALGRDKCRRTVEFFNPLRVSASTGRTGIIDLSQPDDGFRIAVSAGIDVGSPRVPEQLSSRRPVPARNEEGDLALRFGEISVRLNSS